MSIPFIDVSVAAPGVCFRGSGWECDSGVCVSVLAGDAEGDGAVPGCGMWLSCCAGTRGLAEGDIAGVGITWVPAGCGDEVDAGVGDGEGMTIPGVCLWPAGMGVLAGLIDGGRLADFRLADFRTTCRFGFRVGVARGLALGLLVPGIE